MEVILLEKIENLGGIGDTVKVKSGYGRNYLSPQGKATLATPEHLAEFEARRAELEAKAAGELSNAEARAQKFEDLKLVIKSKAGTEGKLFGSVGTIDIAAAATAAGVEVARSEVRMPEGPIRVVGEHTVEFHLHTDVNVEVQVVVEAEE